MRRLRRNTPRPHRFLLAFETDARKEGYRIICGLDEAGRGPLAGPVIASAIILKTQRFTVRIDDSKRLSAPQREAAFTEIIRSARVGIGRVDEPLIDRINIFQASRLAMERALRDLDIDPEFLLIDGRAPVQSPHRQLCLVNGESRSLSIACASIIAKVTRDRVMAAYDRLYPRYGFIRNKGYATDEHLAALKRYGPSPIHRKSFRPVAELLT